jgi:hypothetical protein
MPGAYLYGWDSVAGAWVKLLCNAAGKLIIDPSEILEDTPTDGEVGKAPTSNWAHDHADLPDVHHGRQHALSSAADHTGLLAVSQLPALTALINTGTYVGDATTNKAIAHGLGRVPTIIFIWVAIAGTTWRWVHGLEAALHFLSDTSSQVFTVTIPDATYFYVGNPADYATSGNNSGSTYRWVAIG